MKNSKPEKIADLLSQINDCLNNDLYKFTKHSLERKLERDISILDILQVLRTGKHEKSKDVWDSKFNTWNYAVKGRTIDNILLRIVVSFDPKGMLIITVIKLR